VRLKRRVKGKEDRVGAKLVEMQKLELD